MLPCTSYVHLATRPTPCTYTCCELAILHVVHQRNSPSPIQIIKPQLVAYVATQVFEKLLIFKIICIKIPIHLQTYFIPNVSSSLKLIYVMVYHPLFPVL